VSTVLAIFAGALGWSFTEYCIHRGLGHRKGSRNPFSVEHLKHHATVTWFAPTWKKAIAAVFVLGVTALPLYSLFGADGLVASVAFATTYITYEVIHRRLHTHPGASAYGRWARRHHLHHHFSRPRMNHGVTTPLWDWVFGTLDVPRLVTVPRANALPWMIGPDGALEPALASEYVLAGRPLGESLQELEPLPTR
jgi:sterol desaturase/sphingolipid hydroxylase (fatty acid hydroxylase superfamily)